MVVGKGLMKGRGEGRRLYIARKRRLAHAYALPDPGASKLRGGGGGGRLVVTRQGSFSHPTLDISDRDNETKR